jgi:hypothetical protein
MAYCKIQAGAVVTAHDHASLLTSFRQYRDCLELVREFVMDGPLTAGQIERLPKPLSERLTLVDASVERLERLLRLPDPRESAGLQ